MFRVKVCGVTRIEDALMAEKLGAQAVGFVFTASPRKISPDKARLIARSLPNSLLKVGVFWDEDDKEIEEIVSFVGLDAVQIHGEKSFSKSEVKFIKAFKVEDKIELDEVLSYKADAYLFDSGGGQGITFDWELVRGWKLPAPIILAGGLTPQNVEEAIRRVRPSGVDVSSGVEKAPGIKDISKMRDFLRRAKRAFKEIEE